MWSMTLQQMQICKIVCQLYSERERERDMILTCMINVYMLHTSLCKAHGFFTDDVAFSCPHISAIEPG